MSTTSDTLDPEIRRFVSEVSAGFARYPLLDRMPKIEARQVAEEVRAPWRRGGPGMDQTFERHLPVEGGTIRVRVHDPLPGAAKPALVYMHGGGWTIFSIDTHDRVMREYAARASVVVIGVDYPLSPESKFPTALHQVVDVVRWLAAHGDDVGVDAERLAIGGDSAGANLALAAALVLRDAGESRRLKALLLNYGAFDTELSREAERRFGGADFMLTGDEMRGFWSNYLRGPEDASNPLACPLRARLENLPPAFLTVPQCDLLSEQSRSLQRRLQSAGVPVRAQYYAGATHSFLEAVSISALADRAFSEGSHWLREILGPPL